ncbi:hypothetical protein CIT26_31395 [Mesorhizobium temperatum]|uniref:LysR substrate-binding domain-containing protein n=1 Tax=Mesorhizobium temperatum TaxID=241416 RepID=A0A271LAY6_9HYPH|nr:hypothetical protein CIT26_31395 [Mesorhizobium temperatum]
MRRGEPRVNQDSRPNPSAHNGNAPPFRAGAGLSVLPDFLVREELAAGRLVQILPDWQLPSGGIYTVYPAARFRAPKVTMLWRCWSRLSGRWDQAGRGGDRRR